MAPLNIVMKLVSVNDRPVAKLSNELGKETCENPDFLEKPKEEIKPWLV